MVSKYIFNSNLNSLKHFKISYRFTHWNNTVTIIGWWRVTDFVVTDYIYVYIDLRIQTEIRCKRHRTISKWFIHLTLYILFDISKLLNHSIMKYENNNITSNIEQEIFFNGRKTENEITFKVYLFIRSLFLTREN